MYILRLYLCRLSRGTYHLISALLLITCEAADIPVDFDEVGIEIPVTLCNTNVKFMLDTGTSIQVLDRSFKDCVGARIGTQPVDTISDTIHMDVYDEPRFHVYELSNTLPNAIVLMDFQSIREHLLTDVRGLLGMSFLHDYDVAIMIDRSVVRIAKSISNTDFDYTTSLSSNSSSGIFVQCVLPGLKEQFQFDTGDSSTGSIDNRIFEKLLQSRSLELLPSEMSIEAGNVHSKRRGRIKSLVLGPYRHTGLIFFEGNTSHLGLQYLRRFNVLFEFRNMRLSLSRSKHFDESDTVDPTGLSLIRRDGHVIVNTVDKGSPAEIAGLLPGDTVLHLNYKSIDLFKPRQIARQLENAKGCMFSIRRGIERKDIMLR